MANLHTSKTNTPPQLRWENLLLPAEVQSIQDSVSESMIRATEGMV